MSDTATDDRQANLKALADPPPDAPHRAAALRQGDLIVTAHWEFG